MAKFAAMNPEPVDALKRAGLADENTRRVVIDIQADHAVVVHTEKFVDDSVIDVIQTLSGVEITRKDSDG
ncbi:MAG TPA: hypothetical protein VGP26_24550 [Actinophytocola sp.]|jgi:hypothetical protein|nr:hypothetical protein [Actinophytocola sp.]